MNLTIKCEHMMLFHGRPDGMTILLPKTGHSAKLKQVATNRELLISGMEVSLLKDGQPLSGSVTLNAGDSIADINTILEFDSAHPVPAPSLLQGSIAGPLAARVLLAGGTLTPDAPVSKYSDIGKCLWSFLRADNSVHTQKLTDCATYTLPLDWTATYVLRACQDGNEVHSFDISEGSDFVLSNTDYVATDPANWHPSTKFNRLEEFELHYQLLDWPDGVIYRHLPLPETMQLPERVPQPGEGAPSPLVPLCPPARSGQW